MQTLAWSEPLHRLLNPSLTIILKLTYRSGGSNVFTLPSKGISSLFKKTGFVETNINSSPAVEFMFKPLYSDDTQYFEDFSMTFSLPELKELELGEIQRLWVETLRDQEKDIKAEISLHSIDLNDAAELLEMAYE
jgi:hypothetical protein